jgi:3-hydroxyisobutyrate dehydrogenase-like beta-hydroxyacid dehydrogenase
MSDVTVIGLGAMGSAIANAFMNAGHETTVWNRSADKMHPLRISGAHCAETAAEAGAASPVVIICIDDYAATWKMFEQHGLGKVLSGKTLVQFSTGTPKEARDSQSSAKVHGTKYLDGALLAYPREIGQDGIVAISGEESSYIGVQELLDALSSDIRYLGTAIGAAAALDVAVLSYYVCTHLGLIHGALICESENVPADVFTTTVIDSQPSDAAEITHLGQALLKNEFSKPGASIGVYSGVLERILSQARDAGIDATIPEFVNRLYKRGIEEGLADEEVVALIKLLRR